MRRIALNYFFALLFTRIKVPGQRRKRIMSSLKTKVNTLIGINLKNNKKFHSLHLITAFANIR